MKLVDPTDDQLNAAFAEHVAGWEKVRPYIRTRTHDRIRIQKGVCPTTGMYRTIPNFTRSADAVLSYLEKCVAWERSGDGIVSVSPRDCAWSEAASATFPRAAVIALLRAHGHEIEFTK